MHWERSWSREYSLSPYYNSGLCKTTGPCANGRHLIRIGAVWPQQAEPARTQKQKQKRAYFVTPSQSDPSSRSPNLFAPQSTSALTSLPKQDTLWTSLFICHCFCLVFCPLAAFCSYAPLKAQFIFFGNECAVPICHIEIMQMTDSINR